MAVSRAQACVLLSAQGFPRLFLSSVDMSTRNCVSAACEQRAALSAELSSKLKEKRLEIKTLSRSSKPRKASLYMEKVTRSLVAQREGSVDAARVYLTQQKEDARGALSVDAWCTKLQKWWAETPKDTVDRLLGSPVTKTETVAVGAAINFLKQTKLHNWVTTQNVEKNVAPSVAAMLKVSKTHSGKDVADFLRGTKKRKYSLQRLQRWRRRWNVRLGGIAERTSLPVADRRRKVRRISSGWCSFGSFHLAEAVNGCASGHSDTAASYFFGVA